MHVYVGLKMLVACIKFRFPCFLLVSGVWDLSSGICPSFPLAGGLCQWEAEPEVNDQYQRPPLLVQYKEQANPFLSMNNYTPLVIAGMKKK
jgi:hypothetical protein